MTVSETSFACKVQLSKAGGIEISIRDLSQPSQVYKQIIMDGTSFVLKTNKLTSSTTITQTEEKLTTQVTTETGTTTIEQGPEEVKVTCKRFVVEAESIQMKSSKDTNHEATGKYSVESTQDYKVTSKAKWAVSATSDLSLETQGKAHLSAPVSQVSVSSPKIELTAQTSLSAESSGALSVKGGAVTVKGDMRAELTAPQTTVGNAMTTIEGNIVTVTGSLVKLG